MTSCAVQPVLRTSRRLLIYFGWPRAHEDDATRGVRSALEIVQAVKGVSAMHPLAVRIGQGTGPVVVGDASRKDTKALLDKLS